MSKPNIRKINWKAEVDKVEPKRYEPTTEYKFSNGKKFKRRAEKSGIYT